MVNPKALGKVLGSILLVALGFYGNYRWVVDQATSFAKKAAEVKAQEVINTFLTPDAKKTIEQGVDAAKYNIKEAERWKQQGLPKRVTSIEEQMREISKSMPKEELAASNVKIGHLLAQWGETDIKELAPTFTPAKDWQTWVVFFRQRFVEPPAVSCVAISMDGGGGIPCSISTIDAGGFTIYTRNNWGREYTQNVKGKFHWLAVGKAA